MVFSFILIYGKEKKIYNNLGIHAVIMLIDICVKLMF